MGIVSRIDEMASVQGVDSSAAKKAFEQREELERIQALATLEERLGELVAGGAQGGVIARARAGASSILSEHARATETLSRIRLALMSGWTPEKTLDSVRAAIAAFDGASTSGTKTPMGGNARLIQRVVASHFHIDISRLLGFERYKSVAFARHLAMYLCRSRLAMSFPELGRAFTYRDHTSIISGVRKIEALIRADDAHTIESLGVLTQRLDAFDGK